MSPTQDPALACLTGLKEQFLLDPEVLFFNHGSFGACPRPVFEAYQAWQRELEREPVAFFARRVELLNTARCRLAAEVGADPKELVFCTNVTYALNAVAHSLRLNPGDEVLSTELEYGAMNNLWEFACGRAGARFVRQPLPIPLASPQQAEEAIWAGVTPRTKVLFLSHVTSGSALILPVAALIARARAAGLLTVIDGAHAPGYLPLDLHALGADLYGANCHKWLLSPKGAGFLYVRRGLETLVEPLVVSGGFGPLRPGETRLSAQQEWQGTRDLAAFLVVPAALDFATTHHWEEVRRACHLLADRARAGVRALTGLECATPDGEAWYRQMTTLPLPSCDGPALHQRLLARHRIEIPVTHFAGRDWLRLSVQGYNTAQEIEALLAALAEELAL